MVAPLEGGPDNGFWTTSVSKDPKRNFRWLVIFPNMPHGATWYAKKMVQPKFSLEEAKHNYLNHTFYYPGRVTWETITCTLVDPVTPHAQQHFLAALLGIALISLVVSMACGFLAIFTLLKAKHQIHYTWGIFNANLFLWCLGLYFIGIAESESQALFYWKLSLVPNTFIPVFFYHLVYSFCQLQEKRFLAFVYLQGILFSVLALFDDTFVNKLNLIFDSIYFAKATPGMSAWLLVFLFITCVAFYRIWQFIQVTYGDKKTQALYLFWGMLVGFGGGFTLALPPYGILIYGFRCLSCG